MIFLMGLVAAGFSRGRLGGEDLTQSAVGAGFAIGALFLITTTERSLHGRLFHGPDLLALVRLPASGAWMVRRQWARAARRIPFVAIAALVGAGIRILLTDGTASQFPGSLLFAGLLSAVVLSAATWLSGTGRGAWVNGALWTTLILYWIGSRFFPGVVRWTAEMLNQYGGLLVAMLPTGWVIHPFQLSADGTAGRDWLFLIPAVVLIVSLPEGLQWLTSRVRLRDHAEFLYAAQLPEDAGDELRESVHESLTRPPPRPLGELRDDVLSRTFLQPELDPPQAGWIERRISRSWTSRERLLSELAFGTLPRWTRTYLVSTGLLVVCLGAGVAGHRLQVDWLQGGWFAAVAILLLGIMPAFSPAGRLGRVWEFSQGVLPLCAVLPVGIPEIGRWSLRAGRIRILLGMPIALGTGSFIGWYHSDFMTWQQGAWGAVVVCISLFGFQPLWLIESLLGQRWPKFVMPGRWIPLLTWCGWGLLWLLLAGGSVATVCLSRPLPALALAIGAALTGTGGFRWFCGKNRRGRLDWIYPARPESSSP